MATDDVRFDDVFTQFQDRLTEYLGAEGPVTADRWEAASGSPPFPDLDNPMFAYLMAQATCTLGKNREASVSSMAWMMACAWFEGAMAERAHQSTRG